jgi:hypothetical protein
LDPVGRAAAARDDLVTHARGHLVSVAGEEWAAAIIAFSVAVA